MGLRKGSGVCDRPEKERNMIKTKSKPNKMHNIVAASAIIALLSDKLRPSPCLLYRKSLYMRWEQAGQQVGDGAGLPNWALLTTQAHKQHTGWESSSSRLQKQRWPQLPQPRSRKISGGTTVCEVSHQVLPLLISFLATRL